MQDFRTASWLATSAVVILSGLTGYYRWGVEWVIVPLAVTAGLRMAHAAGPKTIDILEYRTRWPPFETARVIFAFHILVTAAVMAGAYLIGLNLR